MGWFFLLPYFTFHLFLLLTPFPSYTHSLCNHHDSFALLQLKNSLLVRTSDEDDYSVLHLCPSYTSKTESWKNGTDCCEWHGVTCNNLSGHVIGLDLSCSHLEGKLYANSTFFQLRHLQRLNLAFNNFSGSSIHSAIGDLVSVTHLNLSNSRIGGDIPPVISHLSKLVSLSLGNDEEDISMSLDPFTWKKLILNATNLRELHLDNVNMSSIKESSLSLLMNLSSSLVSLTLSNTGLHGNFQSDILSLPNLQRLDLSSNEDLIVHLPKSNWSTPLRYLNLSTTASSGEIPNSIGHLKSLNQLILDNCYFAGLIPPSLWNLTQMTYLSLPNNTLQGKIPSLLSNLIHLTHCHLSYNKLSGQVPSSLFNLTQMTYLSLSYNNFQGEISSLLSNLIHLTHCHLSVNNFSGPIPNVFGKLIKLESLRLSTNKLSGQVPSSLFNLTQMTYLSLTYNNFQGEISSLLSNLIHLTHCHLSVNNFSGPIPNVFGKLIKLESLRLSSNNLSGQFPSSLFNLTQLSVLDLSSNNLVGPIPNEITQPSKLVVLQLNGNMINGTIPQWCYSLPSLEYLYLDENRLTSIGEFSTYSLKGLSLSNNKLQGDFPISIFKLENLIYLNLSSNSLSGLVDFHQFSNLKKLEILDLSNNSFHSINNTSNSFNKKLLHSWKNINQIDLSFNKFQGELPILPNGIGYFFASNNNFTGDIASTLCNASSLHLLNLAHNNLSGMIPQCLGSFPSLSVLDLQMNNFTGDIASTLCNASSLSLLNLAHNNLSGMIPQCFGSFPSLSVLDLQMNNFRGSMPGNFSKGNEFQTIKLNGNQLEGPLPQSLVNCTNLQVLDLGDNIIEDVFPSWLETLQELQVLSLRSNKLHGAITCSSMKHPFPNLRIFDVSNNNFSGLLPKSCIKNFQGMMIVNDNQTSPKYIGDFGYYDDSVVVIIKGTKQELTKILTTFTTIDLSNNMFEGEILEVIGELHSLKGLNLSHNGITGTIPHSLSNLTNLEWLDLSRNKLMGEIPMALTNLNFLSTLNLSQNQLDGMIPTGKQFNTFGNDSYEGNPLLCGFPLSKSCKNNEERPPHSTIDDEEDSGFGWKAVVIGYACGAVFGALVGYNVLLTGKPQWLARLVESVFNTTLKRGNKRVNGNRRRLN